MDNGSFWGSGYDVGSACAVIDEVLQRPEVTLEDLLEQNEVITECKYMNEDLTSFLSQPPILHNLVGYCINLPEKKAPTSGSPFPDPMERSLKYPYVASEVIATEVPDILNAIAGSSELLTQLFSFFDREPPIEPENAAYFSKVLLVLINKKRSEIVDFVRKTKQLDKILNHIGLHSVMELLIRMGWDDGTQDGAGLAYNDNEGELGVNPMWLSDENLVGKLIDRLSPQHQDKPNVINHISCVMVDIVMRSQPTSPLLVELVRQMLLPERLNKLFVHAFAGRFESLAHPLSVAIVLVQSDTDRRLTEREEACGQNLTEDQHREWAEAKAREPLSPILQQVVNVLPQLLEVLDGQWTGAENAVAEVNTQRGKLIPLGTTRIKIVSLILQLVRSETEDYRLVGKGGDGGNSVAGHLVKHGVLGKLLELFFECHWNNMLHGLVENLVHTILDTMDDGTEEDEEHEDEEEEVPTSITILRNDLFGKANLLGRLQDAYAMNEEAVKREPRDGRLGFMGHLIRICGELRECHNVWTKLKKKLTKAQVLPPERLAQWEAFMKGDAAKELERQQILLGGHRPGMDDEDDEGLAESFQMFNTLNLNPNNYLGHEGEGDDDDDDDEFFDWGGAGPASENLSYDYDSDEEDETNATFNADFGNMGADDGSSS